MMNARISLIIAGATFGLWETVDIFRIEVPAAAALFAALFLGCTAWFWRRGSVRAATALLVLFSFEAAAAPTWKDAALAMKLGAVALGLAGITAAIATLVAARRSRRSRAVTA